MPKSKTPKLFVELIPSTCHYSNVRTTVSSEDWDKIRFFTYKAADHKCEICGDIGKNQGYRHNVECHEIWDYDDKNHIQRLIGLIALCPVCHHVKHIGRSIAIGIEKECFEKLAQVNKWTEKQIEDHLEESFAVHKERSKHQWDLDLSILTKDPYNVKLKFGGKRLFEQRKFKKKKYRKTKKKSTKSKKTKRPPKRK